jgi:HAD superfamily hydrolase (TIGR01549 family)
VEVLACDWNGTCVDDVTRAWRASSLVLSGKGLDAPDLRGFLDRFRLPLQGFFADLGVPGRELGEAEAEWNEAVASEPALPMPHLAEMLDALEEAEVAVGVVSAAEEGVVRSEARALGIEDQLAFVAGSASPKRRALSSLVETYGEGRVAYLGDTEHDVEEALAAGALAIGFGGGYRPAEALARAGAELVVSDLREVPGVLSRVARA